MIGSTGQQDLQSPYASGAPPRVTPPTMGEAYSAAVEANDRLDAADASYQNQRDFVQGRISDFTGKTGVTIPPLQTRGDMDAGAFNDAYAAWLQKARDKMQDVADDRGDQSLALGSDEDIARGGLSLARRSLQRQADLQGAPGVMGSLGRVGASAVTTVTDPYTLAGIALSAPLGGEGGALATVLRSAGIMGGQQLIGDAARYGYRQQVDPSYGVGDVVGDVAGAAVAGGLFGGGEVLGGQGFRRTLGGAAGGAAGGALIGGYSGGGPGALEGAAGGAALPLLGAGAESMRSLGMSWRSLKARSPEIADALPLALQDAGEVAEKAGDLPAQKPNWPGASGDAAHGEAVAKIESDMLAGRPPELPPAAQAESQVRRGQVFYPGGAIEARYGVAEHGDLVTSHDADFNLNPAYPTELQPRDRSSAPARDQVTNMAGNLEPERLGPSVEANAGTPIVGPDGVVESGNGRTLAIGQAYDMGRGNGYRQWLEGQGFDTTGFDKPILVGMRETPLDDAGRAAFAHAANGSASLRMSATEQALSDARLIDGPTLDQHQGADLASAANRDFARAVVAKLPQGERGGMLTRDGGLSAGGVARVRNALTARAYGDPAFLGRALDHPDPNIKAIAGALGDAAGPWARMRDAATAGDILPGHDITRDLLQAVHAVMRARDEGRPAWEVLNQGDMFQSDTTQLAARMLFRDEGMRQPAGRGRIAEALTRYAEESAKNTTAGRLFGDDVGAGDILRQVASRLFPDREPEPLLASLRRSPDALAAATDQAADDVLAMARQTGEPTTEANAVERLTKVQEPRRPVPGFLAGSKTTMTARQLEREIASRKAAVEGMKADPSQETYPGRLQGHEEHVAALEDARKMFGPDYKPDRKPFSPAKIIDAGSDRVVSVATDERHGALADAKTFRIYDKPDGPATRARDLGRPLGQVDINRGEDGRWEVQMVDVSPRARGKGVATALYGAVQKELGVEMSPSGILLPDGHAFWKARNPEKVQWHQPITTEEGNKYFMSPKRIGLLANGDGPEAARYRAIYDSLPPEAKTQAALDAMFSLRQGGGADQPSAASAGSAEPQLDLALRNPRTGAEVQAQDVAPLAEMLKRFDSSSDAATDPLSRATRMVMGDRLSKIIGDMKVYTVGRDEMRALMDGRMKAGITPGYEPAGFFDPRGGHIVVLDDVARNPAEMSQLLAHEGLHGAFMRTIEDSDSARNVIDHLRDTAAAVHFERGGEATDHYGLGNAHEFVSEALSNPEFQRFLASIPADDRMVQAFGLDKAPGNSLWDVFVGAVRKILGLAPDQHTLLDATLRVGRLLDEMRQGKARGAPDDVAPALRLADPDARRAAAQEQARKARAMSDAKAAISYAINADRIAQHPNGPLAGFLGILTRDIRDAKPSEGADRTNVESVQQVYEGRFAHAMEKILEPYASKWAGLKQDVAGIRDVIRENFGVDTRNATAKIASQAWREGVDKVATEEAKRLGKVFTPAEDWRHPQWWESSRAQKFGKARLLDDMRAEVATGGLRIFDPATGEEANPLRRAAIMEGAAEKIVTDASLGGTHGGAFKTDMRVFRFADGAAGAESYLRLMDKYGAGRGGYVQMMQAHVGKVSRELGLLRMLGPNYMEIGQKLLDDALLAHKVNQAARGPRDAAERLADLPGDAGKLAIGWLESPAKAKAVWEHMSGQASGVGSELMAGLMSGTRGFMTSTRMGSAFVTAVPADTVNYLMAAKHNGLPMGRMVSEVAKAFLADTPARREEAARLGIAAHAGIDAAIGVKRFQDQFLGEGLMKRLANFVIRAQGLHPWDGALRRVFPMEFLGTIAQHAGKAFGDLDEHFANFLERYGLARDWPELSRPEHMLDVGPAKYLHPDNLPEALRVKLMSAIYDERQFAYLAGGTERVRAISAQAKAGTLSGEAGRSIMLFKSFAATMLATWGMRSAQEAAVGRIGTLASLVTGMTFAGALAMQARSLLQGKDPRNMKDPYFWGESFLQGGAAGIYGDFFKEAFSRSDTSLTETMMGPLAAIPAGIQGLTSGARRMAEDGEKVNFGAKLARIISQNTPGGNLWYTRLLASRLLFDNIQRMIDRDHDAAFARQQRRAMKTDHQGFYWAPGQNAPGRAPDAGAMVQ